MESTSKLVGVTHSAAKTDRLLTSVEAATILGLKPGTMYDLVQAGKIDHVKLFGKSLRFRESVILRIIADSEVVSTISPTLSDISNHKKKKINGKLTPGPSLRRRGVGAGRPN